MNEIPVNEKITDFKMFIDLDTNKRVIFSGPFGIGKTYFINKFFDHCSSEYFPIIISPVNYSIASNQDIFSYIRYDILYDLYVKKEIKIEDKDINRSKFLFTDHLYSHPIKILTLIAYFIPKLGKQITDVINKIEEYRNEFNEFNSTESIIDLVDGFRDKIEKHPHFALDDISLIIEDKIKQSSTGKQSVLIIDDLDRLDPDHIFRIFNIFSSQFSENEENKLGFDKIVFVCDIHNIRNIFSARFGSSADFSGYIDKFYSTAPFYYNNFSEVKNVISKLTINIESKYLSNEHFEGKIREWIIWLLTLLNASGDFNLRNLFTLKNDKIIFNEIDNIEYIHFFDPVYKLLMFIYGNDLITVIQKLDNCRKNIKVNNFKIDYDLNLWIYSELLLVTDKHQIGDQVNYTSKVSGTDFIVTIFKKSFGPRLREVFVVESKPKINISNGELLDKMIEAVKIFNK